MAEFGWARDQDLRQVYSVIEEGRRDHPGPALPWASLDGLFDLIKCAEVSISELDFSSRCQLIQQAVHEGAHEVEGGPEPRQSATDPLFWTMYPRFWASRCAAARGPNTETLRWSDMFSRSELSSQPMYTDFFRGTGVKHCMFADLPTLPGRTRRILFWRTEGPDFSDRDKMILDLLRPHLFEAYQRTRRQRPDRPKLTAREWDVLELAGQGYRNADIARLLVVSIGTVRKHMEHIFDRTGTRTRAEAVATMMS